RERGVDDRAAERGEPLERALPAVLVAVAHGGEQQLPDGHRGEPDDDDDEQGPPEGLAGQRPERTGLVAGVARTPGRDLHREPGHGEVQQPVPDEPDPGQELHRAARRDPAGPTTRGARYRHARVIPRTTSG